MESLFLFLFAIFLFFRVNSFFSEAGQMEVRLVLIDSCLCDAKEHRPDVTTELTTALGVRWIAARRVQIKCVGHAAER